MWISWFAVISEVYTTHYSVRVVFGPSRVRVGQKISSTSRVSSTRRALLTIWPVCSDQPVGRENLTDLVITETTLPNQLWSSVLLLCLSPDCWFLDGGGGKKDFNPCPWILNIVREDSWYCLGRSNLLLIICHASTSSKSSSSCVAMLPQS